MSKKKQEQEEALQCVATQIHADGGDLDGVNAAPDGTLSPSALIAVASAAKKLPRDKALSWRNLANQRVPKAIKAIQAVARLGNRANYTYGPADASKVWDLLQAEMDALRSAYAEKQDTAPSTVLF